MASIKYLNEEGLSRVADYVNAKLTFVSSMPVSPDTNQMVLYVGVDSDPYFQGGVYKFDGTDWVLINMIKPYDVEALDNRIDAVEAMITGEFDATQAYAIGDIVIHEDGLFKFKVVHTANDPWSATEVDAVDIIGLVEAAEPESLTATQVNTIIGLLD